MNLVFTPLPFVSVLKQVKIVKFDRANMERLMLRFNSDKALFAMEVSTFLSNEYWS